MKIIELQLLAFGCFDGARLAFGDGPAFHVIAGPNEAGKSTALRALTALFYGIPTRTTDGFRHKGADLRIGAELARNDGQRLVFVRRKGLRKTLLDAAGEAIDDSVLDEFLGRASEEMFNSIYRLDHLSLVRGGDDLLAGKGDLAQSLFQAGTGMINLRTVLDGLAAEAEKLFKRAGQNPLLNQAVAAYEQARTQLRVCTVTPRAWIESAAALKQKEEELRALRQTMSDLSSRKEHLGRVQLALPHVTRRLQLLHELDRLGPVTLLPETATAQRERLQRDGRDAETQKAIAEKKLGELRHELAELEVPGDMLLQADAVTRLYERVDGYRGAARDLPKIRLEQAQFESAARTLLAEVQPELSLSQAESLRLTAVQRNRIRDLASNYAALEERRTSTMRKAEAASREYQAKQQTLASIPPVPESDAVERCLEGTRKQGDLEARLRIESAARVEIERQAQVELKRLPAWTGFLQQLESLPVPLVETTEGFAVEKAKLDNDQKLLEAERMKQTSLLRTCQAEIRALRLGGTVPTEEDLARARQHRDDGWRLVRVAWLDGQRDPVQEQAFDPGQPLPEAFEATVQQADGIADRLRREADRVARLASLLADEQLSQQHATELEQRQQSLHAEMSAWHQRWHAIWKPAEITPLSPVEMRGWLTRHSALLALGREIRIADQKLEELKQQIRTHQAQVSLALTSVGLPAQQSGETLSALLGRAQSCLIRMQETAREHLALQKEVARLDKENQAAARERAAAQEALESWGIAWQQAIAPLNLPGQTRASDATGVLEKIDALFRNLSDLRDRAARVAEMEGYTRQFEMDLSLLIPQLRPELAQLRPDQAATQLQALLAKAQQNDARREKIEQQITTAQGALGKADGALTQASKHIDALLLQASCADMALLQEAETKSVRARQLKGQLDSVHEALMGFAAGASLDAFIAEVAAVNPDQVPFQLRELEEEIRRLDDGRSQIERDAGSRKAALDSTDSSELAVRAADEAQAALAAVRAHAQEYIRLRLASEVLRRHIERYREQNQDPIIRRAGEIFPCLTLGSFARLKTSFDEKDRPILLGVRPTGEEVDVSGMSDGTRDQLFLALRLASLDRQLSASEPLPFILDDILLNFDDARARATLEQLAQIAARTQVLFFTHHSRLVELAQEAVPAALLHVHQLETNPISSP